MEAWRMTSYDTTSICGFNCDFLAKKADLLIDSGARSTSGLLEHRWTKTTPKSRCWSELYSREHTSMIDNHFETRMQVLKHTTLQISPQLNSRVPSQLAASLNVDNSRRIAVIWTGSVQAYNPVPTPDDNRRYGNWNITVRPVEPWYQPEALRGCNSHHPMKLACLPHRSGIRELVRD